MFHGADGSAVVQLLVLAEPGAFRQMLAEMLSIIGGLDVTAAGWNERPQGRRDAALASLVGQPGEALEAARGLAALPKLPAVVFFDRALDRVHVLAAREMGARGYRHGVAARPEEGDLRSWPRGSAGDRSSRVTRITWLPALPPLG